MNAKFLLENLKGRNYLGALGATEKTILKSILEELH
jgi:hypothetical protein